MDENNHYVNAIKNPLLYGCIKKQEKNPSLCEFNVILNNLMLKMKKKNKNLFNEMYVPVFKKSELIEPCERSALQLLNVLSRNEEKDIINTFKHSSKTR